MILLRKNITDIYVDDDILEIIELDDVDIKNKINKENLSANNRRDNYINNIMQVIKFNIEKNKNSLRKYKNILYNIQTEDVIVRNIENINISNKKDVIGLIKYNIIQYMPIDLNDYEIKYNILNQENNIATVQVILFPKYIIELCKGISKSLGMKTQAINVNFDILQKLIEKNIVSNFESDATFIETRKDEFLLNKVTNNRVLESYILPRNTHSIEHLIKLEDGLKNLYCYGKEELIISNENQQYSELNINPVILNMGKKSLTISKDLNQDANKYVNAIGVVI